MKKMAISKLGTLSSTVAELHALSPSFPMGSMASCCRALLVLEDM